VVEQETHKLLVGSSNLPVATMELFYPSNYSSFSIELQNEPANELVYSKKYLEKYASEILTLMGRQQTPILAHFLLGLGR
jgi:hypothetical protein